MNNVAWVVLFVAALTLTIMVLGYIFGHGLLHFAECTAFIVVVCWAMYEVSRGSFRDEYPGRH